LPERQQLFQQMSVADNLGLGAYTHRLIAQGRSTISRWFTSASPACRAPRPVAGTLSGGGGRWLALGARCMAPAGRLLLEERDRLARSSARDLPASSSDCASRPFILLVERTPAPPLQTGRLRHLCEGDRPEIVLHGPSEAS